MFRNATPEKAIMFTRFCVALACCWPPPLDATKSQTVLFKFVRTATIVNGALLVPALFYGIYVYQDDPGNLSKASMLSVAVSHMVVQTSMCITQYDRFQMLIHEMKVFCREANAFERGVLQQYVDTYKTFYGMSAIWLGTTGLIVVLGTPFTPDPFPTRAEYPFNVYFEPLNSIIYVHQGLAVLQCASHMTMNVFCALLLLFTTARFEILIEEARGVKDFESLIKCVEKYRALKRYATEVSLGMRIVAVLTIIITCLACVFNIITIIGDTEFSVKVQAAFLLGVGLLSPFMCAMPADHLMELSETSMQEVYGSEWYEKSLKLQKSVLFMMVPQPSIVLSVKCIMPALNLNYFCSFLSTVYSLFTALRMAIMRSDD